MTLTISGLRCASEGAPLERALRRLEGVSDATVNPLRERVAVEVDRLPRLEPVLRTLGQREYSVDHGEVEVTTWIGATPARLAQIRDDLLDFPAVTYCRVAHPTGRLVFGLALGESWEGDVREVCNWLCDVVERESSGGGQRNR